jgi:hypothetical protein
LNCKHFGDWLKMYPQWHFLASLLIGLISFIFNQNVPFFTVQLFGANVTVFALCIIVGVIIDVDHIIDIHLYREKFSESNESRYRNGRMILVFHGMENTIVLATLSTVFPFLLFPTISYTCHIVLDMLSNRISFQAYFYTVRFRVKLAQWRRN